MDYIETPYRKQLAELELLESNLDPSLKMLASKRSAQVEIDTFLEDPEEFVEHIPESCKRLMRSYIILNSSKGYDEFVQNWLCQKHVNGYECGVTIKQVHELSFEELFFLSAIYRKAGWYKPIDIRGNDKLQDIYEGFDQEIKDFIHYYVVTQSSDQKMTIPGWIQKVRSLCGFRIGFSSKSKSG